MTLDRAGLRVLTRAECLRLLSTVALGRVAVSYRALPMILPVHFRLEDDDTIVIHARRDTTLHRATDGTVVAFEAEGPAGALEPMWSVVVRGLATHESPAFASMHPTDIERVEIRIADITGRELVPADEHRSPLIVTALLRS